MTYIFLMVFILFFSTLLVGNLLQFRFKKYLNEEFPELYNAEISNISEGIWTGKAVRKKIAQLSSDHVFLDKLDVKAIKLAKTCRINSWLSLVSMIVFFLMFPISILVNMFF